MITDLILPKFNMDMESAVLLHWLRAEGDRVAAGDPVAEVSTDKVNMEVEATADGILFDLRFAEGDTVPVTVPIARIASDESEIVAARGSSLRSVTGESLALPTEPPGPLAEEQTPGAQVSRETSPGGHVGSGPASSPLSTSALANAGRIRATPAARRLARELGLDLATVASEARRITVDLVREAANTIPRSRHGALAPSIETEQAPAPRREPAAAGEVASPEVATAGARLFAGASVWTSIRLDNSFSALYQGEHGARPGALWTYLVARALREHPRLNSSYERNGAVAHPAAHIAVEVAGPSGLVSTVVCDADRRTLLQIDREIRNATSDRGATTGGARTSCRPTFTIVDFSETDVDGLTPAPRAPQVATLGIGRRTPRVVARGEGLRIEPTVQVALSFDPRVIHESDAASFLATLSRLVMTPGIAVTSLRAAESVEPATH